MIHPYDCNNCHFQTDRYGYINSAWRRYLLQGKKTLNDENKTLGVIIMSGGQGSRLGSEKAKGIFELDNTGVCLFDIHMKKLNQLRKSALAKIILLIMTSPSTFADVSAFFDTFFKTNNQEEYCNDIEIFNQDMLPVKSLDQKTTYEDFKSPNGNGGIYEALKRTENYKDVDIFNIFSVDNVAAQFFDKVSLGCFVYYNYDILNKTVNVEQSEKVGGFTFNEDHSMQITEYSKEGQTKNDEIQGNICNHLMSKKFIDSVEQEDLKENIAIKDPLKGMVLPEGEKKIAKIEYFIFDPFTKAKKMGVINVDRNKEFVPLKSSEDLESVRNYIYAKYPRNVNN